MTFEMDALEAEGLAPAVLEQAIERHVREELPRLERLWSYYRNERTRGGALAQEAGLPGRLRGKHSTVLGDDRADTNEAVIENDIAWRVDAMVDFVFGKAVRIRSDIEDESKRDEIERFCEALWEHSGGLALLQDAGLLAAVHGHIDFVVRCEDLIAARGRLEAGDAEKAAELCRIEVGAATRGIGIVNASDYRQAEAYMIRTLSERAAIDPESTRTIARSRFMKWFGGGEDTVPGGWSREAFVERLEVLTPHWRQVYIDRELVEEGPLRLGELAVVHVQNRSEPFRWAGVSEVEGLIPLQNELNTRLSDRAHRVTMQSFNMYLAKGIESFGEGLVGPGRVWTTDNLDAQVQSFGGDGHSPSEERHIEELRSAMDKSSAVSPVVLGTVRERLGHLSSANALRITLMGVLSKAERKRVLFGAGIRRVCELALSAADKAGVIETSESERRVRIEWSDPLPISEREQVQTAIAKEGLGVERAEVLRDIGETDPGVE